MTPNLLEQHDAPRHELPADGELLQIAAPVKHLEVAEVRQRLTGKQGRHYWRSLEELAETPQFRDMMYREFPQHASEWDAALDRRKFLSLMGASLALAGLAGCTESNEAHEKLVPYVQQPEQLVPGKPLFFATAMPRRNGAIGLLAESHIGRPTKLEGNELHPASRGATDLQAQAAILSMYDPDRSQTVKHLGQISTWEAFLEAIRPQLDVEHARGGQRLRILTENVISPTLERQLRALLDKYPQATWHQYEPICNDQVLAGAQLAFGEIVDMIYHFDRADVVLSLESDFMTDAGCGVRYAQDISSRRRPHRDDVQMNRLYVIEGSPSCTGTVADHRWPLRSSEIGKFAEGLAQQLDVPAAASLAPVMGRGTEESFDPDSPKAKAWLAAVAEDLQAAAGRSIVVTGRGQPASVHALAHAINDRLGNVGLGKPIEVTAPLAAEPVAHTQSMQQLVQALSEDKVDVLLMIGGNPVYDAPADLKFAEQLAKARVAVHLSEFENETSVLSPWHLPQAHFLESWSDTQAFDGTAAVIQPLIKPLYQGITPHQLLSGVTDQAVRDDYELLQETWSQRLAAEDFAAAWRKAIHDGVLPETAAQPKGVSLVLTGEALQEAINRDRVEHDGGGIELTFLPDPSLEDGRWANNGWLQEVPKPWTKLCWDNALLLSQPTAQKLQVDTGDVVQLSRDGFLLKAAVWVLQGQALGQGTLHLGYGRTRAGRVGNGVGFDAYQLRTTDAMWIAPAVSVERTGESVKLATTQDHGYIEGRRIIREATLEEYQAHPYENFDLHGHGAHREDHGDHGPAEHGRAGILRRELAAKDVDPELLGHADEAAHSHHGIIAENGKPITLLPDRQATYEGPQWGMSIDLSTCMGCNACVVACQAENNIPVVGKEGVERNREMHWLRIDRYFTSELENPAEDADPQVRLQPMLCQHCEKAPCELVCPVAATTHSPSGLNEMTYNRCVGTRYCSNNCPYKVRRFNFFNYVDNAPVLELLRNPDVTVRTRGVMEKCTYCVQRISNAGIAAKVRDAEHGTHEGIRDGEVVTACQAACPTRAIAFGDVSDPNSAVSQWKAEPRNYAVLEELGVVPRTTYLGVIRNPHPKLRTFYETSGAASAETAG